MKTKDFLVLYEISNEFERFLFKELESSKKALKEKLFDYEGKFVLAERISLLRLTLRTFRRIQEEKLKSPK